MPELYDAEFGEVSIKTVSSSRHVKLRVLADGKLGATIPNASAVRTLQHLINESRDSLRPIIEKILASQPEPYRHNQQIGASHRIIFEHSAGSLIKGKLVGTTIVIMHPATIDPTHDDVQAVAKTYIKKALKQQATHYLPRRLRILAEEHGFSYKEVSFGNAKGRWGSCSSSGVIRLNIALMKLPLGLIDYVLVHELSHTRELNHSSKFWNTVEHAYPHYKSARTQIKQFSPYI